MRNAFAAEMTRLAGEYPELVLLSGDMGNRLFNDYKRQYPDRFYNCGVAEANMTSVAAGMAMCGLKPVTYSIAPFNTIRCLEQIKIDICYHQLPVLVVGVGAGLSYSELGPTHQSCDDISIMRSLPGMTIVCPGDAVEVRLGLREALKLGKPVYLRLGKKNEPVVHDREPEFKIGKGIVLEKGTDVCLISTGNLLPVAKNVEMKLKGRGVSTSFVSFHTIKPLDNEFLDKMFDKFDTVVTIEEHSLIGGFGSAVAEWMQKRRVKNKVLLRFGYPDELPFMTGPQEQVRKKCGLSPDNICSEIIKHFNDCALS